MIARAQKGKPPDCHPYFTEYELPSGGALIAGTGHDLKLDLLTCEPDLIIAMHENPGEFKIPEAAKFIEPSAELKRLQQLTPGAMVVPTVHVACQDGGAPEGLNREWWAELAEIVRVHQRRIALCCVGGHGRTGLAYAILAKMLVPSAEKDPILFARKHHCPKAVETNIQVEYVNEILGVYTKKTLPPASYDIFPKLPLGSGLASPSSSPWWHGGSSSLDAVNNDPWNAEVISDFDDDSLPDFEDPGLLVLFSSCADADDLAEELVRMEFGELAEDENANDDADPLTAILADAIRYVAFNPAKFKK